MGKKVSKSNTPVWAWVIIFIILLQIAKLAHRNEWFSNKNPNLKKKHFNLRAVRTNIGMPTCTQTVAALADFKR